MPRIARVTVATDETERAAARRLSFKVWALRGAVLLAGAALGASCPWWPDGWPRAVCEGVAHVLRSGELAPPKETGDAP